MLVSRGHRRREWLLDSTFVRSCKSVLFGLDAHSRFSERLAGSLDLHRVLLIGSFFKFGVLVRPSHELLELENARSLDPCFELRKRIQQHRDERQDGPFPDKRNKPVRLDKLIGRGAIFANENRNGDGSLYICDATATGKTLQVIPVGKILEKMDENGNGEKALGIPLIFSPARQILNRRAKNQQAIHFAQMELRVDLETIWREQEKQLRNETIVLKLVLPSGSEPQVEEYLLRK